MANVAAEARLTLSWARRELHSRYRQSSLRIVWSLIQPLGLVAVYALVFRHILDVSSEGLPYLSFVIAGVVVWRYLAAGLAQATSLVEKSYVLDKIYFRREIVPLAGCVAALIDLGIGLLAVVVIAWFQGITPSLSLLALPAVIPMILLYTGAFALLTSTVTVFVRDLAHAMPTIQQALFLVSPIMYGAAQIPDGFGWLAAVNPVAASVEGVRDVTLRGRWPVDAGLVVHSAVALCLFVGAMRYLRSIEHRIVDVV